MHSGSFEKAGSPRKRTLSRGVSEDESLRNIIKETENSTRRLTRSDSRGTLKKQSESQSEQDLIIGFPEMEELQESYKEVVQELSGLEVQRETLLFQVDVLQDALEGVEEMLAEAQRAASQASMELEREREAKKKLEDMVSSLMQEVERLKEERNTIPSVPVYTFVREEEGGLTRQKAYEGKDQMIKEAMENIGNAPSEDVDCSQDAPLSINRLESIPLDTQRNGLSAETSTGLLSFLKKGRGEQSTDSYSHPPPLHDTQLGSSVDLEDVGEGTEDRQSPLSKLHRMVNKTFGQMSSLALGSSPSQEGVFGSPEESQTEAKRDASPDRNDTDSISAYEDASADTPELENVFPVFSGVNGTGLIDDACPTVEKEEGDPTNEARNPNDSCIVS
ncbi:leucine-rich repeat flightless-interacting protein 1 isoform X2 [Hypomesus transpacificus]|uniref:leucine-rich repeat flightless-interacting protein 1 isoform X2 n=1 Tax=Hypomesus transpacificus TaxID=137520 RepID=UPI001F081FDC|nr:leucine-rich repeat flightless-interacting protein 1 isoform X2 [Hypomesus transpacificus]